MSRLTYSRDKRIRKRREFLACYERGRKFHGAHFLLFVHDSQDGSMQFGASVSKKVGNAVKRNRVKRLLREFFRSIQHELPSMQFVAVAKSKAAPLCLADLRAELEPLVCRALNRNQPRVADR